MRKKNFWGKEQDELIIQYKNSEDIIERERIILKIYPKLKILVSTVLYNYFNTHVKYNFNDYIDYGISQAILSFDKYQYEYQNTFSYLQRVVKNYYYSEFVLKTIGEEILEGALKNNDLIDKDDENYFFQYEDKNISNFDFLSVTQRVAVHLKDVYYSKEKEIKFTDSKKKLFNLMISTLEEADIFFDYDAWIINLYRSGFGISKICSMFEILGINANDPKRVYQYYYYDKELKIKQLGIYEKEPVNYYNNNYKVNNLKLKQEKKHINNEYNRLDKLHIEFNL